MKEQHVCDYMYVYTYICIFQSFLLHFIYIYIVKQERLKFYLKGVPEEIQKNEEETIFKEVVADDFSELRKDANIQIQEIQQILSQDKQKEIHTLAHLRNIRNEKEFTSLGPIILYVFHSNPSPYFCIFYHCDLLLRVTIRCPNSRLC